VGVVDILKANVGVKQHGGAEDGIHNRVEGATDEGSYRERNQTDRKSPDRVRKCIWAVLYSVYRSKVQW